MCRILLSANIILKMASLPHRRKDVYINDLDPETNDQRHAANSLIRRKKSSVSWLLAAAIRMCQKHPQDCLRQKEIQENMDVKSLMQNGR